jgi:signal transduction histidine kinase
MKALSLRASLMLWVIGLTSCVLAAFAFALHEGVRRSLLDGLDAELRARAENAAASCEWEDGHVRVELPESVPVFAIDVGCVEARAWPSGDLVHLWGAEIPVAYTRLASEGEPPRFQVETVRTQAGRWRVVSLITELVDAEAEPAAGAPPSGHVLVRAARNLAAVEAQLASIAWFTAGVSVLLVFGVVCFSAFLSRRIARPLRDLGVAAAGARRGERQSMPNRGSGDEIDELAIILEDSFRELHVAAARQRRFAADASHELRNPLAAMQNAVEVALRRPRSVADHEEVLVGVLGNAKRMGRMLEALLLLARMDSRGIAGSLSRINVFVLAREVAAEFDPEATRIEVSGEDQAAVMAHEELLAVALRNLIDNALRHTSVSPKSGMPSVSVEVTGGAEFVAIRVRDQGGGIAADLRERVFEPFFRGEHEKAGSGAGLGLAIVAAVAAQHRGRCEVERVPVGACFLLQLPAAPAT